jgi:PIN domain nuclease of toxin-antitoxin system
VRLLLDTHVLLWWLRDLPELSPQTKAMIANPDSQLIVSVASFWEIAIKWRRGQIDVSGSALHDETVANRIAVISVAHAHLKVLEAFEFALDHKDPFDHMITAQAVAENAVLVTADRRLLAYPIKSLRAK